MLPTGSTSTTSSATFRLLGPIEVVGPDGSAKLSGNRQLLLVGLLALYAPTLLTRSQLVDAMWGDEPPRTAVKTLHSHIARVRRALDDCGLPGILRTRDPGYRLDIDPCHVDVNRFEELSRLARADLDGGDITHAVHQLRSALALWRGDALADAQPSGWASAEVDRLHQVRLGALGDLWDGELRLGHHETAVLELPRLLIRHPFHEPLVRLAMLALYRSGRHSDALAWYQRLRTHLAAEFGTEPSPDLARLHVQILRRDPTLTAPAGATSPAPIRTTPAGTTSPALPEPVAYRPRPAEPEPTEIRMTGPGWVELVGRRPQPAELPGPASHFTGRDAELAELDRLAADTDARVLLISGAAGIGKTSLAVHWAHRQASAYPDGQIFFDLRGHDPATAMDASEALAHVLAALNQPDHAVPTHLSGRASLYRTLTRDRRILIVADNAGGVEQVLPLVPASPTTLLVVTTRTRLAALATHHPVSNLGLDALSRYAALDLLGSVLGKRRLARESGSAARLVELCDRLPLALQIAAAKLAGRPGKDIGDLVRDLAADQRLDELSVEGSRSVRAVLATAYQALTPSTARIFRTLGLHPGPSYTAHLAAAAVELTPAEARRGLDELVAAHLIVEISPERYRFHDLLRLYARECARLTESPAAQAAATTRMLDWYLAVAAAANRIVDPGRDRVVPVPRHPPTQLPFATEAPAALAFLDGERDNLLPVLRHATQHGYPEITWQLTYLVTGFFDSRGHWAQRVRICRWGVVAARRAGDPTAEGLMRSALGVAYLMTRHFGRALDELRRALALMRQQGDRRGEAHVHNNIAVAHSGTRQFAAAVASLHRALALHMALDSPLGVALCLNNLGDAYVRMGRADRGMDYLTRALAASRRIGNARLEAAALGGLGQAHQQLGCWDQSVAHFTMALDLRQRTGDRGYEADTLNHLGLTEVARGRYPAACRYFQQARTVSQQIADPHQEAIALAQLGRLYLEQGDLPAAHTHLLLARAARDLAPDPQAAADIERDLVEWEHRSGNPVALPTSADVPVEVG